jgi:hypothetical protein
MKILQSFIPSAFAVFVSGASVMALEMLGSRLITPVVGATINAWTALISVFLTGIAAGYSLGDAVADKKISFKILGGLFLAAALFVSQIFSLNRFMNLGFSETELPYWLVSLLYTTLLLLAPAILLGAITVYTIRLSVQKSQRIGRINGLLYALSTMGSLVGIIGTSFYLVPFFPLRVILFFITGALAFTGSIFILHGWHVDKIFD